MLIPDMSNIEAAEMGMFEPLPAGTYIFQITNAEERHGDRGSYISITLEVSEPAAYEGRVLYDSLHFSENAIAFSKAKLEAISYDTSRQRVFHDSEFVGRKAKITTVLEGYVSKTGEPRVKAKAVSWDKPSGNDGLGSRAPEETPVVVSQFTQADDDIPF